MEIKAYVKDRNVFPCRKIGITWDNEVVMVEYEILYIEDNLVERTGLPQNHPFDKELILDITTLPKPISILDKKDVESIICKNKCIIRNLIEACEWATDTFITKDAREYLEKLKKEINKQNL